MGLYCRLRNIYVGCVMYADDLVLMSASILDLQVMLNVCGLVGHEISMKFNCESANVLQLVRRKLI